MIDASLADFLRFFILETQGCGDHGCGAEFEPCDDPIEYLQGVAQDWKRAKEAELTRGLYLVASLGFSYGLQEKAEPPSIDAIMQAFNERKI